MEVLLASVILALSASGILSAFAAGHQASAAVVKRQQAHILASNLMEEIKRFQNFENGDYAEDSINGVSSEPGETCGVIAAPNQTIPEAKRVDPRGSLAGQRDSRSDRFQRADRHGCGP